MRTTLTIHDDIREALRDTARRSGKSFEAVVNETLRRGLSVGEQPPPPRKPFRVAAARRGFATGVDPLKLNRLANEPEPDRPDGRGSAGFPLS